MSKMQNIDSNAESGLLWKWLAALKNAPVERDPEKAIAGRVLFLENAENLGSGVSEPEIHRHTLWIFNFRKERLKMSTVVTIIVVLSILFGGGGATVYAAQDSMPDQPLYGLKLVSENVRMELALQSQTQAELNYRFANRRVGEAVDLVERGQSVPLSLQNQWESQVREMFRALQQKEEGEFFPALLRLQQRLQYQEQLLSGLNGTGFDDPVMLRIRERLQVCLENVSMGLGDPEQFRFRLQNESPFEPFSKNQFQNRNENQAGEDATPNQEMNGKADEPCGLCEQNQEQNGNGPDNENNENGFDGCLDCDPYGPSGGSGDNNPWVNSEPEPGSGNGPGDGSCGDCQPQGPSAGPGPQNSPEDSGSSNGGDGSNSGSGQNESPGTGEKGGGKGK